MTRRKFTNVKRKFKKTWDKVLDGLSREIYVYLSDLVTECSNCYYDKVNRTSSGVPKSSPGDPNYFTHGRCPVCFGRGVIITSRRRCISAIVNWNPAGDSLNSLTFTEAGFDGATIVEIKTDPCYLDLLKNSKHVVIDGVKCKLARPPILRGLGDQHILIAHLFTDYKPMIDSGERVNQ